MESVHLCSPAPLFSKPLPEQPILNSFDNHPQNLLAAE
jgi:hypothetical protein